MKHYIGLEFLSILTTASARSGSNLNAVLTSLALGIHTQEGRPIPLPLPLLTSLFEQLDARANRGRFIFALADSFNFDAMPAVSAFLASAHSLRQLNSLLEWVPVLVHPNLRFDIEDHGSAISLHPRVDSEDLRLIDHPLLVELMMAIVAHISAQVAPNMPGARAVTFKHAPAADPALYEAYFKCPVGFHGDANTMIGDNQLLDGILPGSLPQAHKSAEETIRQHLLGDGLAPPLTMQIDYLFRQRLSLFSEGLAGLAKAMNMHPRTLQRQLRHVGSSYSMLLRRLRHEHAADMLRDPSLDIDSIALKLGFTERRSFTLAFRQWQGCSPREYRYVVKVKQKERCSVGD